MTDDVEAILTDAARLKRVSRWAAPLLAAAALMVIAGLYLSSVRIVELRSETQALSESKERLLSEISTAQQQLAEIRATASKMATCVQAASGGRPDCLKELEPQATTIEQVAGEGVVRLGGAVETQELSTSAQAPSLLRTELTKDYVREQLNGPGRRAASDALVDLYVKGNVSVVDALASAALADTERSAYRINLYILYTLARIPGGWTTSNPDSASAIEKIANSRLLTKDETYRRWAKQALERKK